jgi:hypothetical protein
MPVMFRPWIVLATSATSSPGATVTGVPLTRNVPSANVFAGEPPLTVGQLAAHAFEPTNTQSPALTPVPPPAMPPLPADLK